MKDRHISSKSIRVPLVLLSMMREDGLPGDNPGTHLLSIYEHLRREIQGLAKAGMIR